MRMKRSIVRVRDIVVLANIGLGLCALRSALAQDVSPRPNTAVVTGIIRNSATSASVRIAVVRMVGGRTSTLSNDMGRYRLELPLGEQRLEVRRIGYRPATVTVTVLPGGTTIDVALEPIPVELERVLVSARDDEARRIIAAAIRRKQALRGAVHDYRYDGEVRLVVRNLSKPADSASSILVITQTRTSAYWEEPNRYQETIVARRQTGNLPADQNLVGVGQIANFSRDRVQLGRFELPSPVADDALDRYDYRVLDTLAAEGRRIFRLSLEPKPDGSPAFAGIIDIADSTYDVTAVDVGVNNAVRLGLVRNVRYQQRFADMGGGRWMPRAIELAVDLYLPIGKSQFNVHQMAELSGFRFNEGQRPAGLGEYRIVVADSADRAAWREGDTASLTPLERRGWERIDSIAQAPRSLRRRIVRGGLSALEVASRPDFFHYNRVDGAYTGAGWTWYSPAAMPTAEPTLKLGHAEASDLWQYRAGGRLRLSDSRRLWVGAVLRDETVNRPTLTSPGYNPTLRALFSTIDPLDYYRARGVDVSLSRKLVDFVRLDAGYADMRESSLPLAVSRPPFRGSEGRAMRPNAPIDAGHRRALSAAVIYDSRPMLRQAGRDVRLNALQWTRVAVETEWSPGRALASDYSYRRYTMRLDRRRRSFGLGVTSFLATGGIGTRGLPSQRFFGVDGGAQVLAVQASPFSTLVDSSFTAPRAAVLSVQHDFDRLLFTKSRIRFVEDIPFTITVRGSAFWTETTLPAAGQPLVGAPYREAGFSVGNLTPFAAPFNLSARFAWQVSNYPTTPFRFSLGFGQ